MVQDPLRVAVWRYEQIGALLDPRLTASQRCRLVRQAARVPVLWPSGREGPVPQSTLYRWLKLYRDNPKIESLTPRKRSRSSAHKAIRSEWVGYALGLLEEEPDRSLFILSVMIRDHFGLDRPPSRSSLHQALQKEPRYWKARKRARGEVRLRKRFQARNPHEIWHGDALGPIWVKFLDSTKRKFHILSILDDATRFVLVALIVLSESTRAVVAAFRQAAARYGLCLKFYADRGTPYDSGVFRKGLAILGVHRIKTKPRNASAHGKIEAYHRPLRRWFVGELPHQPVLDVWHLQELLSAVIEELYNKHTHREIKTSPGEAFRNATSPRLVSLKELRDAFMIEKTLSVHPKTATVRVKGDLFLLPKRLRGQKRNVKIAIDPEDPAIAFLVLKPGVYEPLEPAVQKAGSEDKKPSDDRQEPAGSLTPLLERYRGRILPQARAGFGLPEIYEAFGETLGRSVPSTDAETTLILEWLRVSGPFDPKAFHSALSQTIQRLGKGRPLAQLIQELQRRTSSAKEQK